MPKSVFCALVGKPNMGKSTLLNRFLGVKLAIVSPKPQTTRNRIMGVLTSGEMQYVFLDTPGYHAPKSKLGTRMVKTVTDAAGDSDVAVFLTYPKPFLDEDEKRLLDNLSAAKIPVILCVNKSDTASSKTKLAECEAALKGLFPFSASFCVSAKNGDGCDALLSAVARYGADGEHFFPDDTLTDMPEKVIVAEIVREKLLEQLFEELPHGCGVSVERFSERTDGLIDIDAMIFCEKESHKGMIIGRGGQKIKAVGTAARVEIEDFLQCRVNLQCRVKVKEDWRNSEYMINYLGY